MSPWSESVPSKVILTGVLLLVSTALSTAIGGLFIGGGGNSLTLIDTVADSVLSKPWLSITLNVKLSLPKKLLLGV